MVPLRHAYALNQARFGLTMSILVRLIATILTMLGKQQ